MQRCAALTTHNRVVILWAMIRIVVLLALTSGCVNLSKRRVDYADRASLAASYALMLCDWNSTRAFANAGWRDERFMKQENNPFLEHQPNAASVTAYFLIAAAANATVWAVLPRGWRSASSSAVIATETWSIARNADTGGAGGVCGL